ncbi:hypothetical protein FA95DRAFT_1594385 [Auriscalpium vulgare]|uniref:Uncharacterized protein n=1 Tax=Auriscalpium vulgare TaxID=40419 RepID=A0ACB8S080_9AGAM|nr:hypothetical protein FA95DRAFT_1594385 [Auriscalpium vulgare]
MASPLPASFNPALPSSSSTHRHSYGTRIRQNTFIKPSARLRQASDPVVPRKIKPAVAPVPKPVADSTAPSPDMPAFPPPDILLHQEDAASKVFLAIGRSFLSVDNRAMTIKDLAEMTIKFGLLCQNVSAAGQAITTYIRNHMQRCQDQHDQPLLLRHVLSGTPSDDDLVPALHSRSGGAHCALPSGDNRTTNFRKGTMVWYLSRAAGAPCPFSRSSIRLCDYTENGKLGGTIMDPRERKRERDRKRRQEQQCGQKRKRLSRACADGSSELEEDDSTSESEQRPPKVKLTLRLKPSPPASSPSPSTQESSFADAEIIDLSKGDDSDADDSMSVDSDSSDDDSVASPPPSHFFTSSAPDNSYFRMPSPSSFASGDPRLRRSPSTSQSEASPPPDTDDSDDDEPFNTSISHLRRHSTEHAPVAPWEDDEDEIDWDNEDDDADDESGDSTSHAPGGSTAGLEDTVLVKQEDGDSIGGLLEAWEDHDTNLAVMEVVTRAAAEALDPQPSKVKREDPDSWDLGASGAPSIPDLEDDPLQIKEEDDDIVPPLITAFLPPFDTVDPEVVCGSPLTPLSAWSPDSEIGEPRWTSLRRPSELLWKDAEILGPDSILPQELEEGDWDSKRPKQEGELAPSSRAPSEAPSAMPDTPSADSDDPQEDVPSTPPPLMSSLPSWRPSSATGAPDLLGSPAVRPSSGPDTDDRSKLQGEVVVVHTCEPCTPAISATQLEGVSVYQMPAGPSRLLRRIDTDFVNMTSIINHMGLSAVTVSALPNACNVSQGSPTVCGTWAPLSEAQAFVRQHHSPDTSLDVFLSDLLFERFPTALQDFHRSNTRGRLLNKFGSQFQSTVDARRASRIQARRVVPVSETCLPWERGMFSYTDIEDHLLAVHPSLVLPETPVKRLEDLLVPETPLSPTEQEMFHTLCHISAWESPPQTAKAALPSAESAEGEWGTEDRDGDDERPDDSAVSRRRSQSRELPLRRSKRVAAVVARTRTRTNKRGSKGTLS